jgi:2-dehydropantoate 2-reductase
MRIAIFGVGGAGGYFGAQLAHAGEDVMFIARGEHLRAIRSHGLRVETPQGATVIHPVQASDDPAQAGVVDVALVGVKAWQVGEAAQAMRPMIGPDTFVVPLQNGVEAPAQLAQVLGEDHVLGGLCATFSWIVAPGVIRSIGGAHFIKFGELDHRPSERAERLRQAFERANVQVEIPQNIHIALWEKLLFVGSFGGLGAVTRAPIGVLRSLPETRAMLEQSMHEVCQVARARDIAVADAVVDRTMGFVDSLAPGATTSLQRDIIDGKPSELEAWSGAVVRLGREVDLQTPLHTFYYHSLLPSELRARGRIAHFA